MSQTRPNALDLAIDQAAEHQLQADKALANARAKLRSAESTYATLDAYRADYAGRLRHITTATRDALTNHRRFLDKLVVALDQQQQGVTHASNALTRQQDAWLASMRKLKAMELLRDRRAAAAQTLAKRQEQKHSDEYAARSVRRQLARHGRESQ